MTEKSDTHPGSAHDPGGDGDSGPLRNIIVGTIAGFFLVGGFCGIVGLAFGLPPVAAAALGAFTGIWGGPGFGGMMGFVLYQSAQEKEHEAELAAKALPAT